MLKKSAVLLSLVSLSSLLALAQEQKPLDKPLEKATTKSAKPAEKKAEPPAADDEKTETKTVVIPRGQLPRGWKALNLSDKQKKAVYATRAKFAAKRQALLDQLEKLKDEEMEALTKLLTESQRQQLANLKK